MATSRARRGGRRRLGPAGAGARPRPGQGAWRGHDRERARRDHHSELDAARLRREPARGAAKRRAVVGRRGLARAGAAVAAMWRGRVRRGLARASSLAAASGSCPCVYEYLRVLFRTRWEGLGAACEDEAAAAEALREVTGAARSTTTANSSLSMTAASRARPRPRQRVGRVHGHRELVMGTMGSGSSGALKVFGEMSSAT